mmetsp:Transcript_17397/g.42259  ORF Transcript_17397/g.42259 Transcript_17397/m.42259 type:complete len:400 (+) Transcript_17397:90-1289(+)
MYSDLFDALGSSGGRGGGGSGNSGSGGSSNNSGPPPLLSFKAGKIELALQEDGKFWATPDTRRLQVNIKYNTGTSSNGGDSALPRGLLWEWYDRREQKTLETVPVTDPIKLSRADVPKSQDLDSNDRVYYWKVDNEWRMLWLQDKEEDPELIGKANELLKEPKKRRGDDEDTAAAAEGGGAGSGVAAPSPGNASTSSASTTTRQVDALSNILENLGTADGAAASSAAAAAAQPSGSAAATGGTLTLADLQGAMSGLPVRPQEPSDVHVGLQEVVTPDAIASLLENEEIRQRLLQELPEEQRSEAFLEENLRSPQVQQTLRSLTMALMPDDNGSMDGYHSVIANFQLDAADGQAALSAGKSPIQAFLDCVLASVEKESGGDDAAAAADETKEDGDEEMNN